MPASIPPELTWYIVDLDSNTKEELKSKDNIKFGKFHSDEGQIETEIKIIELENAEESAEIRNPICYIAGEDNSVIASGDNKWVRIRNLRDSNHLSVPDNFEEVSDNPTTGYKALPSNIPGGDNIRFETKLVIPRNIGAGKYNWDYAIEYQYSV